MEKINYNYSLKNIPTPSITSYQLKLIEKVESVIKRMRWKAHFFLNGDNTEEIRKETFGFKSRYHPPQPTELEMFENDLLHIINSIKFRNQKNIFQQKLKADIYEIKKSTDVFVFADKTSNIYKMTLQEHKKLLKENVTKTSKKAPPKVETATNLEAKCIATNLNLSDRIKRLARTPAYIIIKNIVNSYNLTSTSFTLQSQKKS